MNPGEYRYEYSNGTLYYVNNQGEQQGEVTHSEHLPGILIRILR